MRPRTRAALMDLGLALAVLAVLVAANVFASRTQQSWDLTQAGSNTLAPQSVLAARHLTRDLQVIGLFVPGPANGQAEAEALVGLYSAQSPHVKYRSVDPTREQADVKRYGVTQTNTMVLDYGGRTALLFQGWQSEQDFTSALLRLESGRTPVVCWAAGDGERQLTDTNQSTGYSAVSTLLSSNDFARQDVLLAGVTAIPATCDELVILDPTKALPDAAVKAVGAYLAGGGRLLIAAEPWAQDPSSTASESAILQPYGLAFSGALVLEGDASRAVSQNPTIPAVLDYGRSPISRELQGIVTFYPQTTTVTGTPAAGVTAVPISTTSGSAYAIAKIRGSLARQAGDVPGPFTIMETIELPAQQPATGKTRIVAVGTQAFAQNGTLPPNNNDGNLELMLGALQWLAGQDDLVTLPQKPDRALPLALTQDQQSALIIITVVLMPGLMVVGGVAVWWRRRLFE